MTDSSAMASFETMASLSEGGPRETIDAVGHDVPRQSMDGPGHDAPRPTLDGLGQAAPRVTMDSSSQRGASLEAVESHPPNGQGRPLLRVFNRQLGKAQDLVARMKGAQEMVVGVVTQNEMLALENLQLRGQLAELRLLLDVRSEADPSSPKRQTSLSTLSGASARGAAGGRVASASPRHLVPGSTSPRRRSLDLCRPVNLFPSQSSEGSVDPAKSQCGLSSQWMQLPPPETGESAHPPSERQMSGSSIVAASAVDAGKNRTASASPRRRKSGSKSPKRGKVSSASSRRRISDPFKLFELSPRNTSGCTSGPVHKDGDTSTREMDLQLAPDHRPSSAGVDATPLSIPGLTLAAAGHTSSLATVRQPDAELTPRASESQSGAEGDEEEAGVDKRELPAPCQKDEHGAQHTRPRKRRTSGSRRGLRHDSSHDVSQNSGHIVAFQDIDNEHRGQKRLIDIHIPGDQQLLPRPQTEDAAGHLARRDTQESVGSQKAFDRLLESVQQMLFGLSRIEEFMSRVAVGVEDKRQDSSFISFQHPGNHSSPTATRFDGGAPSSPPSFTADHTTAQRVMRDENTMSNRGGSFSSFSACPDFLAALNSLHSDAALTPSSAEEAASSVARRPRAHSVSSGSNAAPGPTVYGARKLHGTSFSNGGSSRNPFDSDSPGSTFELGVNSRGNTFSVVETEEHTVDLPGSVHGRGGISDHGLHDLMLEAAQAEVSIEVGHDGQRSTYSKSTGRAASKMSTASRMSTMTKVRSESEVWSMRPNYTPATAEEEEEEDLEESVDFDDVRTTGARFGWDGRWQIFQVQASSNRDGAGSTSMPRGCRLFADAARMKEKLREQMMKPKYNVHDYYWKSGIFQFIARHPRFDQFTLGVIAVNAVWIAIDADRNNPKSPFHGSDIFEIVDNVFCSFFLLELWIRFMAFETKSRCLQDVWFLFDLSLVTTMVIETWLLPVIISNTGLEDGIGTNEMLKLLRLVRLTRMARLARLLRAVPDLMILIKGMIIAMRSVALTLALLSVFVYLFAIVFRHLTDDSPIGARYFGSVPSAMMTLMLPALMLPDMIPIMGDISDVNWLYGALLLGFLMLTSITVMNMLIGVLCDVVNVVASCEKEEMLVNYMQVRLRSLFENEVGNQRDLLTKANFQNIMRCEDATRALCELGVDVLGLVEFTDFIYQSPDDELSFAEFMAIVLELRGTNTATVKHVIDCQRYIHVEMDKQSAKVLGKADCIIQAIAEVSNHLEQVLGRRTHDRRLTDRARRLTSSSRPSLG